MKKLVVRLVRQSPAMIVAMLALFVALTGTAVATTAAVITGAQIKNNSITGADVKNKSLTPRDFRGSVRGPRGLRGATGAQGAQGVQGPKGDKGDSGDPKIIGYAQINADATTPTVRRFGGFGTTNATVNRLGAGNYEVTLTGNYPGVTNTASIVPLATIFDTNNFHVASLSMDQGSANTTTIVLRVFVWSTRVTPNPLEDEDFSVLVAT